MEACPAGVRVSPSQPSTVSVPALCSSCLAGAALTLPAPCTHAAGRTDLNRMAQRRQARYLDELGAILQVLNDGDIEAVVPCGEGQGAASHAGAHARVLSESFAQVASGFGVLCPVAGEEGGRRRSVQGRQLPQQTHTPTHTHTPPHEQRARQKS